MKRTVTNHAGAGLALVLVAWAVVGAYEVVEDYRQLKYPALGNVTVPAVARMTLPNGMRLFLLEDHELPLISVSARIRVGSIYEPADKIGLAALTGAVMRTGGTEHKTGDQLDDELEQIAAVAAISIGEEAGLATVAVAKENMDAGLEILADVLMHPVFPADKLALAKMQMCGGISRRNDSLKDIAAREFDKLIYGPDDPYARQAEYATVDRITRQDLLDFHKRHFGPNHVWLAACGDFQSAAMIAKVQQLFGAWSPVAITRPEEPPVACRPGGSVNLIRKTDVNQAHICLGHLGGLMKDPDYLALTVMNEVLNGESTGRLFREIRSRQSLAYSVGGAYGMGFSRPGLFSVSCQTKSGTAVHTIRALQDQILRITQEEVSDEELAAAKEQYLNSFVFHFETRDQIVGRMVLYDYYGYPDDFLLRVKQGVERVTKGDILRVAREHLHPDKLQILVVGDPDEFDEPLSVLGQVKELAITIPAPRR